MQKIEELIATIEGLAKETEVGAVGIVHPANNINFMQHVDISKVSAVSQQLHLVAEFQLKECAGIIIWIAVLNRVAHNVHASLIHWVSIRASWYTLYESKVSVWKRVKSCSSSCMALNQDLLSLSQFSLITLNFKDVFTLNEVVERESWHPSDPTTQEIKLLEPSFLKLAKYQALTELADKHSPAQLSCAGMPHQLNGSELQGRI